MMIKSESVKQAESLTQQLFIAIFKYSKDKDANFLSSIKDLLNQGAQAYLIAYSDQSALSLAANYNLTQVFQLFIEKEVNINAHFFGIIDFADGHREGYASSSLHVAADHGFYELAELLLKNNANLKCDEKSKFSPLHIAIHRKFIEIIKLLVEYGAEVSEEDYLFHKDAYDWACDCQDEAIIEYFESIRLHGETNDVLNDGA